VDEEERWTAGDYLAWVAILVGLSLIMYGAYMGAMAIGRWAS
jgi:hypothetical protein